LATTHPREKLLPNTLMQLNKMH